jgi:hypothetical protein
MESAPLEPGNLANLRAVRSVGFIDRLNTPHTRAPTKPGVFIVVGHLEVSQSSLSFDLY